MSSPCLSPSLYWLVPASLKPQTPTLINLIGTSVIHRAPSTTAAQDRGPMLSFVKGV